MEKYLSLLNQLTNREAELGELQLDREELRRLRREAEDRLLSTEQQYEDLKKRVATAANTEQELQQRCHDAEKSLNVANNECMSLRKSLKVATSELRSLKHTNKIVKRDIQKAAAAAANEEIERITQLFDKKLRAKELKVKEAKKALKRVRPSIIYIFM